MKRFLSMFIMILVISSLALVGCSQGSSSSSGEKEKDSVETGDEAASSGPITINPDISGDQKILSKGPHGEEAVSAKTLKLSEEDIAKIKEGKYTAALVMHYAGNDWATAQINGLKATFKRMGIKVVAVTDAQFKAEKQVSDIETVLAKKPDLIVGIPVDPVSTADAFKKASDAGVKVVFMDNTPSGLEAGKDYVSVVSADNYGNGVAAADIMAEKLGKKGKVGVIFHDADYFVTKQRTEAFEATIKEKYPDIEIAARGGIAVPNDGEKVASGMLTKNPDLDGLFVVWDVPAEGALAAVRTAGKDVQITTIDLGTNVALEIASDGIIKGLGAQLPYDQGIAEAILGGYALLGKEAPAYVAVPALTVTKENVLDAWKLVYHKEAPESIQGAAK
ncbi:sugar ABC transporter substrate-binding protein [Peribacillus cavernae]|uniref:Sugar ABC transporter substrate-binding protein n=1 Tax=Peribacillus cavernae TaxID=1674310 RepID=A0A3S0VPX8_9BACI|nr:substrate-binding domain-containing protein [Peribacillus cavernae]MDQ0217413.1 ribose transport system substrate-binding protein [Peribacillus cavernae]RUQ30139.1 sugar ABC transporter substrate-binding protein [Peribacillus cavernae]